MCRFLTGPSSRVSKGMRCPSCIGKCKVISRPGLRLSPGDTVFDVGANIGLFSLEVYQRCHRDVHLYAFEPVEAIFDVLRANVERCTAGDQLKLFDFGLSRTSGPAVFAYYPRAPVLSTAYPDEDANIEMAKEATLNNIMHFALRGPRSPRIPTRSQEQLAGPFGPAFLSGYGRRGSARATRGRPPGSGPRRASPTRRS